MFWLAQLRQRIFSGVFPRVISYPLGGQSWCGEDTHVSPAITLSQGQGFLAHFRSKVSGR